MKRPTPFEKIHEAELLGAELKAHAERLAARK
jgi:hypothetical protein